MITNNMILIKNCKVKLMNLKKISLLLLQKEFTCCRINFNNSKKLPKNCGTNCRKLRQNNLLEKSSIQLKNKHNQKNN